MTGISPGWLTFKGSLGSLSVDQTQPIPARLNEWLEFKNFDLMVTGIRYTKSWGHNAPDGKHIAIVTLKIRTRNVSVNPLRYPPFPVEWHVTSGASYAGESFTLEVLEVMRPNQEMTVEWGRVIPIDEEVTAVLIVSPYEEDHPKRYLVDVR